MVADRLVLFYRTVSADFFSFFARLE